MGAVIIGGFALYNANNAKNGAETMTDRLCINRRQALAGVGAAVGAAALAAAGQSPAPRFLHGVASGDPLADRMILWTRVTPPEGARAVPVAWQVAADVHFAAIVASGESEATAARDWTVKIDATGLAPGQRYFYRFWAGDPERPTTSLTGRTRTLPGDTVSALRFAVVSCSNYPQGFFHVYREIAATENLDAVLHLGDYLYEYPDGGYADPRMLARGRHVQPAGELLTLADYRTRHALYKTDPDLQAAHSAHPFIAVWDDHESANDAWHGGAENHNADEGPWDPRRDAAVRAYFEWMPIREPDMAEPLRTYRRFDFGTLASLIMLDTRLIGRDEQLDYATDMIYRSFPFDFSDPDNPKPVPDPAALAALPADAVRRIPVPFDMTGSTPAPVLDHSRIADLDPKDMPAGLAFLPDSERFRRERLEQESRSMLGAAQEQWLAEAFSASKARGAVWQIVGQQLLMGKLSAPDLLDVADFSDAAITLEQARKLTMLGEMGLPLNLDAWDGYPPARERFYEAAKGRAANVVVLAGDSHNSWAFDLADANGDAVAVEFGTSSVSSPGLADYLPVPSDILTDRFVAKNPELRYLNPVRRGWIDLSVTPKAVTAHFRYVSTVKEQAYSAVAGPAFSVAAGDRRLRPG